MMCWRCRQLLLSLIFHGTPWTHFGSLLPHPIWNELYGVIPTLCLGRINMTDRPSFFELNAKWHVCLFLSGLHIRCALPQGLGHRQTQGGVYLVCKFMQSVSYYQCVFEISESACCLARKDIHSISVSIQAQSIDLAKPDMLDGFHSNWNLWHWCTQTKSAFLNCWEVANIWMAFSHSVIPSKITHSVAEPLFQQLVAKYLAW